ncbi:MAG: hypothetical protein ACRC1H_19570 [Caldilineaceae bacterium]
MAEPWPEDRRREYVALVDLVQQVRLIDNGPNALRRIERAIAIAEVLGRDFMPWLHKQVTGRQS